MINLSNGSFRTMTGGGGGYGNPMERIPEQVQTDVIDGYVSIEGARRDYGVVIAPDTFAIDREATNTARRG